MMSAFGSARLGRDVELRYTNNGDAVCNLSLAFSHGRKDPQTGERATTWVDASLWGKRAEALVPYLLKGGQVSVLLEEIRVETFEGRNGPGHKLCGKVVDIDLVGTPPERRERNTMRRPRHPRARPHGPPRRRHGAQCPPLAAWPHPLELRRPRPRLTWMARAATVPGSMIWMTMCLSRLNHGRETNPLRPGR